MWNFLEVSVHFSTHVWTQEQESDALEHIDVEFFGGKCSFFYTCVDPRAGK
jgi:hypothetical protein